LRTPTILVVDDEPQIRRVMRVSLTGHGYEVVEARTGEEAIEIVRKRRPTLILLDVNMPGMTGIETCRELRLEYDVPIIMLTVRSSDRDKVEALDAGADDYITKPFSVEELFARIRVVLRRLSAVEAPPALITKELTVDFEGRLVSVRGHIVHLTPKEFDLLRLLVSHAGKPLAHRTLLKAIWGPEYGDSCENLRVLVNQLRKKIEPDPARPKYVLTEAWYGYCFQQPVEAPEDREAVGAHRSHVRADGNWNQGKRHA